MTITLRASTPSCRPRREGAHNSATPVDPRIERRLEQVLSAQPGGLPWPLLRDAVSARFEAAERPSGEDVLRVLGRLIVDGRVDERDGNLVIRAC